MAYKTLLGVKTGTGSAVTNPYSLSTGTDVADVNVGDLVVVALAERTSATATDVSDNLGNTYSALGQQDAGNATIEGYYSLVTVEGTLSSLSVTATASSQDFACVAGVFQGPFTSSPLDANPAGANDATSPFTCPASGTLAQALELVIGMFGCANGLTTIAATSPNLLASNVASGTGSNTSAVALGYQLVNSTSSVSPAFTNGANPGSGAVKTSTFKFHTSRITFAMDDSSLVPDLRYKNQRCSVFGTGGTFADYELAYNNFSKDLAGTDKLYWEITITNSTNNLQGHGIGNVNLTLNEYAGETANTVGYWPDGSFYLNNAQVTTNNPTFQTGDVLGLAWDVDAQNIWMRRYRSGSWTGWNAGGSANPATGTGGLSVSSLGSTNSGYFVTSLGDPAEDVFYNFGWNATLTSIPPNGFTDAMGVTHPGAVPIWHRNQKIWTRRY